LLHGSKQLDKSFDNFNVRRWTVVIILT